MNGNNHMPILRYPHVQHVTRRRALVPISPHAGAASAAEVPAVRDRTGHRNRGTEPGTGTASTGTAALAAGAGRNAGRDVGGIRGRM